MSVLIETTVGDLVFDLHTEERPRSTLNFLKLCKIKYYNYCLFHSVRRNFIAQCGDPTGTGRGGESIYSFIYGDQAKYFDLEPKPRIKHKTKGTISFVNNGNDKHGSQFFITLGEGLDFLDGKHTIFGVLSEGFETLERINETICDENHKPYRDVRITHTIILYDPYDDPKGLAIPDRSPEPTQEQLESGRIGADEDIDDGGKSKEEVQKEIEDKELQIGTKILETVGDINEADEKPPENVLFVCKLNPITKAEDLKIIFSRFGKIKSCEIVKDFKTGDSLCYGFVEFKEVESCEKAYFKMDNVLIDDRRIHVDFCQSVGKMKKNFNKNVDKGTREERSGERVYDMKEDRSKRKEEKYSMLFEEEATDVQAKRKKEKKSQEVSKESMVKKRRDSESEDDRPILKKKSEEKRKTLPEKEAPPKRRVSPSPSHSEDETIRNRKATSKKSISVTREKPPPKKITRKERSESSSSSTDDEDERSKKNPKKKPTHKNPKVAETEKKLQKKEKKRKPADESDSETEAKRKVKRQKSESESESEDDEKSRLKKTKKYKKKKKEESEDEHKSAKRGKEERKKTKKTKSVKTKSRSADESDSDDEDRKVKSKSRQKKKSDHSSDESSSEEDRKKQSKTPKTKHRRHDNSSDDDQRKKKGKKLSHKKKVRKRRASSDSDSSD